MVESMKQVSENYLSTEKGYADDWAAYIASCHMTAEEALDYIRTTNTQEDRAAHLVDMADLSARSTFVRNGNPWVHCYEEQQKLATMDSSAFLDKMEQLFNTGPDEVPVLGKYRVGESTADGRQRGNARDDPRGGRLRPPLSAPASHSRGVSARTPGPFPPSFRSPRLA